MMYYLFGWSNDRHRGTEQCSNAALLTATLPSLVLKWRQADGGLFDDRYSKTADIEQNCNTFSFCVATATIKINLSPNYGFPPWT